MLHPGSVLPTIRKDQSDSVNDTFGTPCTPTSPNFHVRSSILDHPFMTSTKNRIFDPHLPLSTCFHLSQTPSPLWTSTCGRHEIHIVLLKRLVQRPSGPKVEIRLYDCNFI